MNMFFSNCDALIDFLIEYYNGLHHYNNPIIYFQGDEIYLAGIGVSCASTVILKGDYIFFVSAPYDNCDYRFDGIEAINLHICKSGENIDQIPTAVIPAYVREELIATLKGEW
jgi:hypothetical protein